MSARLSTGQTVVYAGDKSCVAYGRTATIVSPVTDSSFVDIKTTKGNIYHVRVNHLLTKDMMIARFPNGTKVVSLIDQLSVPKGAACEVVRHDDHDDFVVVYVCNGHPTTIKVTIMMMMQFFDIPDKPTDQLPAKTEPASQDLGTVLSQTAAAYIENLDDRLIEARKELNERHDALHQAEELVASIGREIVKAQNIIDILNRSVLKKTGNKRRRG